MIQSFSKCNEVAIKVKMCRDRIIQTTHILTCKQVLFIARVTAVNFILAMGAVSLAITVPDLGEADS